MLIRDNRKRSVGIAFFFVVICGVLGNLLGILLGVLLPEGTLHDFVTNDLAFGLDPPVRMDLWIVAFSLGFQLRLNVCCLFGMLLGLILYRKT